MMTNQDPKEAQGWLEDGSAANGPLDRELDAALGKYAAVEPRAGLEERILANLRTEQEKTAAGVWWRWSAVAVVLAMIVVTIGLTWRTTKPAHPITANRIPSSRQAPAEPAKQVAFNNVQSSVPAKATKLTRNVSRHRTPVPMVAVDEPKLDQFPSPRPLSEQEKMALEYVEKSPEEAALVAQAQSNLEQRQELENGNAESNPQ